MSLPETDCHGCAQPSAAFEHHDHDHCRDAILTRGEAVLRAAGAKMTPVRQRVLEILLEEHRALGAYDVLKRLAEAGFANQPPVAYRALDFLVEHGLAHRIQRLNAFAACVHPGEAHAPIFLICRSCSGVAEAAAEGVRAALSAAAAGFGFEVERMTLEAMGLCPSCAEAA